MIYYKRGGLTLHQGDTLEVLRGLPAASVDCCVTSPPYYGLRDYGEPGQYGLEPSPAEYVETMRAVFAEVRRVLADDGTLWLNLGDSYVGSANSGGPNPERPGARGSATSAFRVGGLPTKGGLPQKNLLGMPWRVALALQNDGWILRNAIVWDKPNAMPESVTDRLSTTYELVFLLAKSPRYWFDLDPVRDEPRMTPSDMASRVGTAPNRLADENSHTRAGKSRPISQVLGSFDEIKGRNPGDVWTIPTSPFPAAHFAVMAPALAERCILAGCKPGGTVLDPFCGSGTTGMVAGKHERRFVGIDLSCDYLDLALRTRLTHPDALGLLFMEER